MGALEKSLSLLFQFAPHLTAFPISILPKEAYILHMQPASDEVTQIGQDGRSCTAFYVVGQRRYDSQHRPGVRCHDNRPQNGGSEQQAVLLVQILQVVHCGVAKLVDTDTRFCKARQKMGTQMQQFCQPDRHGRLVTQRLGQPIQAGSILILDATFEEYFKRNVFLYRKVLPLFPLSYTGKASLQHMGKRAAISDVLLWFFVRTRGVLLHDGGGGALGCSMRLNGRAQFLTQLAHIAVLHQGIELKDIERALVRAGRSLFLGRFTRFWSYVKLRFSLSLFFFKLVSWNSMRIAADCRPVG